MGLFEEILCFRGRAGAVKDCNDGNESNCVGKGNLRVISAF
jgi:hypothetical protein